MYGHLAYCGLACEGCPIHWATLEEVPEKKSRFKKAIADVFTAIYGEDLLVEAITDCDGCRTDGNRLFSWCTQCPIRRCARERELYTCAECGDYPCAELQKTFEADPAARSRLEVIRAARGAEPKT